MSLPLPAVAKKRGIQTFFYGLAIDVAVSVAVWILASADSITNRAALLTALVSLGKTVAIAVASYIIRRYGDKSGVLPLAPPGGSPAG